MSSENSIWLKYSMISSSTGEFGHALADDVTVSDVGALVASVDNAVVEDELVRAADVA